MIGLALSLALWSSSLARHPDSYAAPWRVTLIVEDGHRYREPTGHATLADCMKALADMKGLLTASGGLFDGVRVYGVACVIDGQKT